MPRARARAEKKTRPCQGRVFFCMGTAQRRPAPPSPGEGSQRLAAGTGPKLTLGAVEISASLVTLKFSLAL